MIARAAYRLLIDGVTRWRSTPSLLVGWTPIGAPRITLSVGQIYLLDNPLLRDALRPAHIKPRLLGHWGTTPGQNFIYVHLNRVITAHDLDMIYISGRATAGRRVVANTYLEGTYSEIYPAVTRDEAGLKTLFRQFSFPGGIPSHVAPETPGSIHEGGELGYSLSHAFGAVFDNPGSDRRVRHRRRRGGDRTAGHGVALEQVPQSGHRRRGAADPASERLQDREPDRARPHLARGARCSCCADTAGSRISSKATIRRAMHRADGRDARPRDRRDPQHSADRAVERRRASCRAGR